MAFDNLKLDKGLYTAGKGFTQTLEDLDPSEQYRGSTLEGLDAYERQLKRFGIRVSGSASDRVEKFFRGGDTAALFPEYVARAVRRGMKDDSVTDRFVAVTTQIEGLDYRSLSCTTGSDEDLAEGDSLPETTIVTKDSLVSMHKHGYLLQTSYEALRYHRLDLFAVALSRIGADISRQILADAVDVLINGDGNTGTAAEIIYKAGTTLTYGDLLNLWTSLYPFRMTTMLAPEDVVQTILGMAEMKDSGAGQDFHGSGTLVTPMGAELIKCNTMTGGTVIGLDKSCTLEKVEAGGIVTDFDRLIDRQFHAAGISATVGFAKIFQGAAVYVN